MKKGKLLKDIRIEGVAGKGKAIGKYNGKVIFVPYAAPGDIADLRVIRNKKKYVDARAENITHFSPDRTQPFCSHFGHCGGCKWQHLNYEKQLYYKQKEVEENLQRIGKVELPDVNDIISSKNTRHYRNKLEYTFSDSRWLTHEEIESGKKFDRNALGFHVPGYFDKVLDIETCYLQEEPSNSIRLAVKEFAKQNKYSFFNIRKQEGFLRNLIVRTTSTGEVMVILSFFYEDKEKQNKLLDYLKEKFTGITSLHYVINSKKNDTIADLKIETYYGRGYLVEKTEDLEFKIGPKSFFQTNSLQAVILYKMIKEFSGLTGEEVVYDLYCGTGTIALFLSGQSKKVIGIESIPEAVEDAVFNAKKNKIKNTDFITGKIEKSFNERIFDEHGKPDIIVLDPPRAGVHPEAIPHILNAGAKKIIYVSCNSATQARDIGLLNEKYKISKIQPVDMFPHTEHVENIVLLNQLK